MDFDEYKIKSFYIKTADMDRPVRVDFIGDDVERIASIVFSLSAHHSSYGIPSILIEADHVAKLSEEDAENFYKSVTAHTGLLPCVFKLRREMRPF
jgi:NurA-like 5'-3' nuclease